MHKKGSERLHTLVCSGGSLGELLAIEEVHR